MNPTIRPATRHDISALIDLCAVLGYQVTEAEITNRLEFIINNNDHSVQVAVFDNQVVGFIHIFIKRLLERPIAGEIGGLAVDQNMQGKGIGKTLVSAAEIWAKDQGCERLVVKSNVMRQPVHAFYQAIGYKSTKKQVVFEKNILKSSLL